MMWSLASKVEYFKVYFIINIQSIYLLGAFTEYSLLDRQLDDLNSVLDALEQKNDRIHAQLRALLENSREIRQDIAMERANNEGTSGSSEQDSKDEKWRIHVSIFIIPDLL